MPEKHLIPEPDRPYIEGYGIPENKTGLLTWDFVTEQMTAARNYWIATMTPDGHPHTVPVWGIWLDNRLHFGGGPQTRWSRNLANNAYVSAHLESAEQVVIIEGKAIVIPETDSALMNRLDDAYEAKYNIRHGPPIWILRPRKVFAWKEFPTSMTRWIFSED